MDRIHLNGLAFYGFHGVNKEEQRLGQKFYIDATLEFDLQPAGQSDNLTDTVSYAAVYGCIKQIVEQERFQLLEALAERICQEILCQFVLIDVVRVVVKKPEAPVHGIFDYFAVEIERRRAACLKRILV